MNSNTELNAKMNELLSTIEVFYHKLQSYHWYVKGNAFFTVHAQLESYYDEVKEEVDEVAETLLMIGGKPVSTLNAFLKLSKVAEGEDAYVSAGELLPKVRDDFALIRDLALVSRHPQTAKAMHLYQRRWMALSLLQARQSG